MKKLEYKRFKCQTELTKGKNGDEYFLATISTDQTDRDGDKIDKVDIKDYNKTVLYRHNLTPGATAEETLPVGHALWVKHTNGKTLAAVQFNRETKLSELLYRFYKNKWMTDWSIGFRPQGEIKPNTDKEGNVIGRHIPVVNLHEFSAVPIGANQYTETEYVQMKELGAEVGVDEDFIKENLVEIVEEENTDGVTTQEQKKWNILEEIKREVLILSGEVKGIKEQIKKLDKSVDVSYDKYLELSDSRDMDDTNQEVEIAEENNGEPIEVIDEEET